MKVIADFCVVPLGVGVSVSEYVAACERVLAQAGLKTQLHAYGTNVEGESTAAYIAQRLENYAVKVTRIASGVPMGGDLKYVDQVTLKKAMEARHDADECDIPN